MKTIWWATRGSPAISYHTQYCPKMLRLAYENPLRCYRMEGSYSSIQSSGYVLGLCLQSFPKPSKPTIFLNERLYLQPFLGGHKSSVRTSKKLTETSTSIIFSLQIGLLQVTVRHAPSCEMGLCSVRYGAIYQRYNVPGFERTLPHDADFMPYKPCTYKILNLQYVY